jgi:hypothetical protein
MIFEETISCFISEFASRDVLLGVPTAMRSPSTMNRTCEASRLGF